MNRVLLLLVCVLSSPLFALDYRDDTGQAWQRFVLEEQAAGKTLLLVIDVPNDAKQLQQVVHREWYSSERDQVLLAKREFFKELRDLPSPEQALTRTPNPLWPHVATTWTQADEDGFSDWVKTAIEENTLVGSGIPVDCADYLVLLRWIYAHDHGLPMATTLAGSHKLVGSWQSTEEWDELPTDPDWRKNRRFKAAVKYILLNIYTHSLVRDLYPIELVPKFLKPGAILLDLYSTSTGHTMLLKTVGKSQYCPSCLTVLYGNLPPSELVFPAIAPVLRRQNIKEGGYLRFRWPRFQDNVGSLVPEESMPGYSLEQFSYYHLTDVEFEQFIADRLQLGPSDPTSVYLAKARLFVTDLRRRVSITAQGFYQCSLVLCDPEESVYDAYSTPRRDKRLHEAALALLAELPKVNTQSSEYRAFIKVNSTPLFETHAYSAADYLAKPDALILAWSSDPRDDFKRRWGTDTLSFDAEARLQFLMLMENWSVREDQVWQAMDLCYADSSQTLTCKPSSTAVKILSTERMDHGFRQAIDKFQDAYSAASNTVKSHLRRTAQQEFVAINKCSWNSQGRCSLYDFFFTHTELLQNMTGDAPDPQAWRYGFVPTNIPWPY